MRVLGVGTSAAAVVAALLFAGCVQSTRSLSSSAVPMSSSGGVGADYLLAADEEDEMGGLLTAPVPAPALAPERPGAFGLRAGMMMTVASETEWKPTFDIGAFYRGYASPRFVYELGVDYAPAKSKDGSTSSQLIFFRGEALFWTGGAEDQSPGLYVLAGAQGISESAEFYGSGPTASRMGAGINLGVGFGAPRGRWDLRAAYSLVLGSDNAGGSILVAAGTSF